MDWREVEDEGVGVELLEDFWLRGPTLGVVDEDLAVEGVLDELQSVLQNLKRLGGESVADVPQDF